jgi:hypothetical protein
MAMQMRQVFPVQHDRALEIAIGIAIAFGIDTT